MQPEISSRGSEASRSDLVAAFEFRCLDRAGSVESGSLIGLRIAHDRHEPLVGDFGQPLQKAA